MRTEQDLIAELDAAAPNFFMCWIAVGFEGSTIFVSASDPDREEQDGGIAGFFTRPFREYADEEWAEKYLEDLRNEVAEGLRGQRLPPPAFG
jgi:hypothetical protein